ILLNYFCFIAISLLKSRLIFGATQKILFLLAFQTTLRLLSSNRIQSFFQLFIAKGRNVLKHLQSYIIQNKVGVLRYMLEVLIKHNGVIFVVTNIALLSQYLNKAL